QVHDLVDMVTAEGKRAGRNASDYVKYRFGKSLKDEGKIEVLAGEGINYVKPDFINRRDLSKDIIFTFRVKAPDRRMIIQFKNDLNNVFYSKRKIYVYPSEMIEIKLNLLKYGVTSQCNQIKIELIPQPEVVNNS
ncbi:MAG: hypothetical protein ACTSRA_21950, partial [Promethearchaeota archaeon]